MNALLSPTTLASIDALATRFATAQPFRHVVIDDFLDTDLCARLVAGFPGFDRRYALNEMGEVGGKAVREHVRDLGPAYRELDDAIAGADFLALVGRITGIPDLLYDPDYVGGGTHENVDGQALDPHIDFNYHPRTRGHRRLNLIVYLNPAWDEAWGGCLELHSNPWDPPHDRIERVAPLMNRCVIFETNEVSWHGFPAITLPASERGLTRKSFAIYLYTRERPASETATAHATVYVPEGLPRGLAPGTPLDEGLLGTLERRFAQFRGQLKFLYTREQRFARQEQLLVDALDQARAALRPPLLGYARQPAAARGYWPDQWAAAEFGCALELVRPATTLTLRVWVPEALGERQRLTVRVNGTATEFAVRGGEVEALQVTLGEGDRIDLAVSAATTWSPAAAGSGGDERQLAWRLVDLTLD